MTEKRYEGWVPVYSSGTDYEADLVRGMLDDAGVSAVILTQRDHAFNLNLGDTAQVLVLVPPDEEAAARELIEAAPSFPSEDDYEDAASLVEQVRDAWAIVRAVESVEVRGATREQIEHARQLVGSWHEAHELLVEIEEEGEPDDPEKMERVEHARMVEREISDDDYWRARVLLGDVSEELEEQARDLLRATTDAELEEARKIVAAWEGWAADLERAALAADPDAPDAHEADEQSMLDTGIDRIRLDFDDDDDD
jgi:hypothetical protein